MRQPSASAHLRGPRTHVRRRRTHDGRSSDSWTPGARRTYWPSLPGLAPSASLTAVVSTHRCGAAPDSHRVPSRLTGLVRAGEPSTAQTLHVVSDFARHPQMLACHAICYLVRRLTHLTRKGICDRPNGWTDTCPVPHDSGGPMVRCTDARGVAMADIFFDLGDTPARSPRTATESPMGRAYSSARTPGSGSSRAVRVSGPYRTRGWPHYHLPSAWVTATRQA